MFFQWALTICKDFLRTWEKTWKRRYRNGNEKLWKDHWGRGGVQPGTHRHWAHGGRVWSTGEPQVVLGDVLTSAHDGDVLPADALLRSVG